MWYINKATFSGDTKAKPKSGAPLFSCCWNLFSFIVITKKEKKKIKKKKLSSLWDSNQSLNSCLLIAELDRQKRRMFFSDHHKNRGCGQKRQEDTSYAIFGVETTAKCCELKRCADQVRSRTDNKILNLNFSPSTKKTTEHSFELFLLIYRYLIFFLKS